MEKKINIAELLKDCPKGMKLDCTIYEGAEFDCVTNDKKYPIKITIKDEVDGDITISLTKEGFYNTLHNPKCVIFPKGKTTWDGFVPPCQIKDGDVIFTHLKVGLSRTWISIFQEKCNGEVATYVDMTEDGKFYYNNTKCKGVLCMEKDVLRQRLATEEEKQKLFNVIKEKGYKWNEETKTLEKFIKQKFKVGDIIKDKYGLKWKVIALNCDFYEVKLVLNGETKLIERKEQDNWELVHLEYNQDKFDINVLVPFESRVLVRDGNGEKWRINFWGFYDTEHSMNYPYECCGNSFAQCIPYEGNEHLLNTNNDCDEYYKNW